MNTSQYAVGSLNHTLHSLMDAGIHSDNTSNPANQDLKRKQQSNGFYANSLDYTEDSIPHMFSNNHTTAMNQHNPRAVADRGHLQSVGGVWSHPLVGLKTSVEAEVHHHRSKRLCNFQDTNVYKMETRPDSIETNHSTETTTSQRIAAIHYNSNSSDAGSEHGMECTVALDTLVAHPCELSCHESLFSDEEDAVSESSVDDDANYAPPPPVESCIRPLDVVSLFSRINNSRFVVGYLERASSFFRIYQPYCSIDSLDEELGDANRIMDHCTHPDGLVYSPVHTSDCLVPLALVCGLPPICTTLAASYFQRILSSRAGYYQMACTLGWFHKVLVHIPDARYEGGYRSTFSTVMCAKPRGDIPEERALLKLYIGCLFLAAKIADRITYRCQLSTMLSVALGRNFSRYEAENIEMQCLRALDYRLGPFYDLVQYDA